MILSGARQTNSVIYLHYVVLVAFSLIIEISKKQTNVSSFVVNFLNFSIHFIVFTVCIFVAKIYFYNTILFDRIILVNVKYIVLLKDVLSDV